MGFAHLFSSWKGNGRLGIRIGVWEHSSPVSVLGWYLRLRILKLKREGEKGKVTCLLSRALKMLGQLTREVVGC